MEKRKISELDEAERMNHLKRTSDNLSDETLLSVLEGTSLDVDYWTKILKNECGVTDFEQLKFTKHTDFQKLGKFVRYHWEIPALKNVLQIPDSYEEISMRIEEVQKQTKECRRLLDALLYERVQGKTRSDDVVKQCEEKLKKTLEIPDNEWIKTCKNLTLAGLIDNFDGQLEMKELLTSRSQLSSNEILKTASDGLALKGILVTNNVKDCANACETVIELPKNLLLCPAVLHKDDCLELGSQAQTDQYYTALPVLGHSIAVSGDGLLDHISACKCSTDMVKSESSEQVAYQTKVNYSYIPTTSCELDKNDLVLCEAVLNDLKKLEMRVEMTGDESLIQEMMEEFYRQYGTHVSTSVVFGGIYTWQATYRSEVTCDKEKVQTVINDALGGLTSMSYSGFGIPRFGTISGEQVKTHLDVAALHDEAELANITMGVRTYGGPQGVASLPQWKMGLLKCSKTWALIDRSRSLDRDFVGIWDLVQNRPNDFSDAGKLAETLIHAWKVMNGLSIEANQDSVEDITSHWNQLLERSIHGWTTDDELSKNAVKYMHQLLDQVEKCAKLAGPEVLVKELNTDKRLYGFLKEVMIISKEYSEANLAELYNQLNRILIIAQGHELLLGDQMKHFVKSRDEKHIPVMMKEHRILNISRLINAVKQTLLPAMEADVSQANSQHKDWTKDDTVDQIYSQASRDIEVAVEHLQFQLKKANKQYELCLLRIALYKMGYDSDRKCFRTMLTEEDVSGFVKILESLAEEYCTLVNKGAVKMEAFLIQSLILSLPENSKQREQEFEIFLSELKPFLMSNISIALAKFISVTPYHWDALLTALEELKKGNESVLKHRAVDLFGLDEVAKSNTQRKPNFTEIKVMPIPDYNTPAGKLLVQLGLTKYYPSKISLQDVISLGNKCPKEDQSETSLPWRILQKLTMLDHHARDNEPKITSCVGEENDDAKSDVADSDWTLDSLLEVCDSRTESLNPLDVFVAVYCCCDMLLKQALAKKMFACRLAIPIISSQLSDDSLQYSLWALRNIIVEWKINDQVCLETSIVSQPIKTVSFLRLGKPSSSKSFLLNNVMSEQAHPTFWNRECPLGSTDHIIANGLVEGQWYFPVGKPTDLFEDVTMFLNLRGDGCNHQKQVKILQTISSVIVCCVEVNDLAHLKIRETMKHIHDNSSKVIVVLAVKDPGAMDKQLWRRQCEQYRNYIGKHMMANSKIVLGFWENQVKTMEDLKRELRNTIKTNLKDQDEKTIEVTALQVEAIGIQLDESDVICRTAKELAEEVISCLKNKSTNDCKKEMLPLQGEVWQKWSNLLRDEQRSGYKDDNIHSKAQIQMDMRKLREKQLKMCDDLSELMKTFLKNLLEVIDSPMVGLYLQWLKILLDEKSRNTLPGLHRAHHKKWLEYQASMGDVQLENELHSAKIVVAEASLGVEHLLREVTQIYEAVIESKHELAKSTREFVDQLPRIAAKLLLQGQPIEVMDGDAANVPLTWVKAVFSSLAELVGDNKLFVVSVLGIQSSGKSTLLNTMFGLQFSVSAGRCTRGVYMQLIKVDEARSDLPYDYVVVVDTEGLHAPELGQLKYDNENQLATFVIGLSDVTILNIKGENVAEVSDVLQNAVHAFLRMKIVNKNFQLHQTCVFIHQNVPAINAKEKMQRGCKKLKERLDEMTREASGIENIVDIQTFNDVIKFDGENNVFYFSDLWHGDPPMASANPWYSEKVQEVKSFLLTDLPQRQQTFLSFLDMKLRIEDLWKGVLSENFVFSFRNSLAAKAYNSLESTCHEKSWDVENKISEWITQEATVKLERCSTEEELETSCFVLSDELQQVGITVGTAIQTELDQFFVNHPLKDIVIEWKTSKTECLKNDTKQCIHRAEREIHQRKERLRVDLVQNTRLSELNTKILTKAKTLADEMKGDKADEYDVQQRFKLFWTDIVNDYAEKTTAESTPIERTVECQLYKRLEKDSPALQQELSKNPLSKQLGVDRLEGSLSRTDIEQSDLSVCTSMKDELLGSVKCQPKWPQYRQAAKQVSNNILRKVDTYLQDIYKLDSGFKEHFATKVIKLVVDGVHEHNQTTEQTRFTLLPSMTVKIAVHACRYTVTVLRQMQREYEETHSIEKKLHSFKGAALSLFKNTVNQCTSEMIAADLLSNHLEVLVNQAVKNRMSGEIVNHVVHYFNQTKYRLIVRILTDLTERPFSDYEFYIKNSKDYSLRWITSFTNKAIFLDSDTASSKYVTYAEKHINNLAQSITKSTRTTTTALTEQTNKGSDMWVNSFCNTLQELPVKVNDLTLMLEPFEDFENLEKLLIERLKPMQENVLNSFKEETPESITWEGSTPYNQILDRLWGCEAQCPFCGEVCQRSDSNHLSPNDCHQCIQHRPSGIAGIRLGDHGDLWINSCNFDIQTTMNFGFKDLPQCRYLSERYHPYREYKKFLPDWDIAPSPNMESSKYWMWFMAKYKCELAQSWNTCIPSIPLTWDYITKEEAVESLRTEQEEWK